MNHLLVTKARLLQEAGPFFVGQDAGSSWPLCHLQMAIR